MVPLLFSNSSKLKTYQRFLFCVTPKNYSFWISKNIFTDTNRCYLLYLKKKTISICCKVFQRSICAVHSECLELDLHYLGTPTQFGHDIGTIWKLRSIAFKWCQFRASPARLDRQDIEESNFKNEKSQTHKVSNSGLC